MATIKFKNHVINRPSNISMKMIKRVCLELGEDYNFTVNDVIQCISRLKEDEITTGPMPDLTTRLIMFEVDEA